MTTFMLPVALLSFASVALGNTIPADPTITKAAILPRQQAADWIGWVKDPDKGTWFSQSCDAGGTWYRSGSYGQCCPDTTTSCPAATACVAGSQIYPFDTTTITIACTSNYNNATYSICNTALIFESFGDPNPITNIGCGDQSQAWSFYREVPPSISASPSATGSPDSSRPSTSKAWIAGVVVGPIVGLALIGLLVFCLLRRRKNKKAASQVMPQSGAAAMGPPAGVQQYSDAKPQVAASPPYTQQGGNNGYTQQGGNNGYNPQAGAQGYGQQPYMPPHSPPPPAQSPQNVYGQDTKFGYQAPGLQHNAAELGGVSSPAGGQYTAELPSETRR